MRRTQASHYNNSGDDHDYSHNHHTGDKRSDCDVVKRSCGGVFAGIGLGNGSFSGNHPEREPLRLDQHCSDISGEIRIQCLGVVHDLIIADQDVECGLTVGIEGLLKEEEPILGLAAELREQRDEFLRGERRGSVGVFGDLSLRVHRGLIAADDSSGGRRDSDVRQLVIARFAGHVPQRELSVGDPDGAGVSDPVIGTGSAAVKQQFSFDGYGVAVKVAGIARHEDHVVVTGGDFEIPSKVSSVQLHVDESVEQHVAIRDRRVALSRIGVEGRPAVSETILVAVGVTDVLNPTEWGRCRGSLEVDAGLDGTCGTSSGGASCGGDRLHCCGSASTVVSGAPGDVEGIGVAARVGIANVVVVIVGKRILAGAHVVDELGVLVVGRLIADRQLVPVGRVSVGGRSEQAPVERGAVFVAVGVTSSGLSIEVTGAAVHVLSIGVHSLTAAVGRARRLSRARMDLSVEAVAV